jgi:uncharacterized protein YjiS (DUF1127 family)
MFLKNVVERKSGTGNEHSLWRWLISDSIHQLNSYIALCFQIKQERNDLAKLTDAELRDIGIHPADVAAERRRSFFDIPADRRNVYSDSGRGGRHRCDHV